MRLRRSQDSFRSRRQELFSGTRGQSYRILRLIRGVWALLGVVDGRSGLKRLRANCWKYRPPSMLNSELPPGGVCALAEPNRNWTGAPRSPQRTWAENDGRPGFPATVLSPTSTCAAFSKESRMRLANATKLNRKSGGSPRQLLRYRPANSRWIRESN